LTSKFLLRVAFFAAVASELALGAARQFYVMPDWYGGPGLVVGILSLLGLFGIRLSEILSATVGKK